MRWTGKRDSKRDRMKETEKGKHVARDVDERSLLMARLLPARRVLALTRPLLVQLLHVGLVNLNLWRKGIRGHAHEARGLQYTEQLYTSSGSTAGGTKTCHSPTQSC